LAAYHDATACIRSCLAEKLDAEGEQARATSERLYAEYGALVAMVKADFDAVIGKVDEFRRTVVAERNSILKELLDMWEDVNQRGAEINAKLSKEMLQALDVYKKALFKQGRAALNEALADARAQMREKVAGVDIVSLVPRS
jgi:hypothetical protein